MQDPRQAQRQIPDQEIRFDERTDQRTAAPAPRSLTARPPIDLGAFESEMRRQDPPRADDPLRELARIVGAPRHEPAPVTDPRDHALHERASDGRVPHDPRYEDAGAYAAHRTAEEAYEVDDVVGPQNDAPRRRPRGLVLATSLVALVAAGVTGLYALTMRPGSATKGDGAVIAAKAGPTRERPADPGGTAVPDQDRAIYEKGATAGGPARVVANEEQPVDLKALPKRDVTKAILPPVAQPAATTASVGSPARAGDLASLVAATAVSAPPVALAGAGEPRRVKSVAVRATETGEIVAIPPPRPTDGAPKPAARPQATSPQPARVAEARPILPKAPDKAPEKSAERVASRAPATDPDAPLSLTPGGAPRAPKAAAAADSTGAFGVQLASRPSEADAKSEFARLQRKHPELVGLSPSVRKAEVNDKTIYRLRVGGMSQEAANELCNGLKASGGACWISR